VATRGSGGFGPSAGGGALRRLFFGALWRIYQIGLIGVGAMLFYLAVGDANDHSYPVLWIFAAFNVGAIFAWGMTKLTTWALDRLYAAFGNKPLKQSSDRLGGEVAPVESLHHLGIGEKPRDFITLRPGGRKHLR
jgi:hypothetical protein